MKHKKFFLLIFLLAALLLCLSACAQSETPEPQQETTVLKNPAEHVQFEQIYEQDPEANQDMEYAIITGVDASGETVWTHVTPKYPIGQDDMVAEVLYTKTQYVFCENGTLISLDIPTGAVLWENREFDGYGVCGMEAENGNLYFCGYLGTSFFAVDSNGNTLHKIVSFGTDYDWAHDIRMEGDRIVITLGLGPEAFRTPDGFIIHVNPDTYSFVPQLPDGDS